MCVCGLYPDVFLCSPLEGVELSILIDVLLVLIGRGVLPGRGVLEGRGVLVERGVLEGREDVLGLGELIDLVLVPNLK